MWSLIFNAALKYIEAHPEVLMDLLDQAAKALIDSLKSHNAAKA